MDHEFSKELAEALIESEQRAIDETELISTAYQRLCHDDPLPISSKSCQALQTALVDAKRPFALSRRLLNGIDQCAKRSNEPPAESSLDQSSQSFVETVESKRESYGLLAWTAHASIPLKCIKAKTLPEVTCMLGSLLDRSHKPQRTVPVTTNTEGNNRGATNLCSRVATNDELEEVFADESDGSDFEFESGHNEAAHVSELTAWSVAVGVAWDPLSLSRPPHNTRWQDVAAVVTELLQECRYNAFSDVSMAQWSKHRIPEQLTQLAIGLLVPDQNKTPIFGPYVLPEDWQRLGVNVLHTFRDAYAQNESILEDYLGLIRILVQLDRASKEGEICTATLAGVGALSALCGDALERHQNVSLLSRLNTSILDACDDLSLLLEKSGSNGTMERTLLPLFEVLSADSKGSNETAQVLLNSGLFRQWLMSWSEQKSIVSKEMVNVSLLELCCYNPALLGKYAWRFQGFAAASTLLPNEDEDQPVINAFCWNLLGIHLSESGAGSATVQWKSKSPTPTIPTKDVCKSQSLQLYQRICDTATRTITDWKVRREHKIQNFSVKLKFPVLEDLLVLSTRLQYVFLRKVLLQDMVASTEELSRMLSPLQAQLVQWPTATTKRERKEEKEDEADQTQELQRSMMEEDAIVARLRKAVKTILSILDNASSDHTASFSSKAD